MATVKLAIIYYIIFDLKQASHNLTEENLCLDAFLDLKWHQLLKMMILYTCITACKTKRSCFFTTCPILPIGNVVPWMVITNHVCLK